MKSDWGIEILAQDVCVDGFMSLMVQRWTARDRLERKWWTWNAVASGTILGIPQSHDFRNGFESVWHLISHTVLEDCRFFFRNSSIWLSFLPQRIHDSENSSRNVHGDLLKQIENRFEIRGTCGVETGKEFGMRGILYLCLFLIPRILRQIRRIFGNA